MSKYRAATNWRERIAPYNGREGITWRALSPSILMTLSPPVVPSLSDVKPPSSNSTSSNVLPPLLNTYRVYALTHSDLETVQYTDFHLFIYLIFNKRKRTDENEIIH